MYQRLRRHLSDLRKRRHANPHLQSAFDKYGESAFTTRRLEYCEVRDLFPREQFYINTLKPDFNVVRQVIDYQISRETAEKISKTMKGKHARGEWIYTKRTPVFQFDLTGECVAYWESLVDATKQFGLNSKSIANKIHAVCNPFSKYKSYKGFLWSKSEKPISLGYGRKSPICVKDTQTNRTLNFPSMRLAAQHLGCGRNHIRFLTNTNTLYSNRYQIEKINLDEDTPMLISKVNK